MKAFAVSLPITGHIDVVVRLDSAYPSEEEISNASVEEWEKLSETQKAQSITWEFTDHVAYGNVSSAELNDICWGETSATPGSEEQVKPPSRCQLWRRVARLSGELAFIDGSGNCHFVIKENGGAPIVAIRDLIKRAKHPPIGKGWSRAVAKLEAAIAEWEAAK